MTFLDRIEECNPDRVTDYVPLSHEGERIGAIRRDRVDALREMSRAFVVSRDEVALVGDDEPTRTRALASVAEQLAAEGSIRRLTGEVYPVAARVRAPAIATVDRAAVGWFGIASAGVHVNGFVRTAAGIEMWVARRSSVKTTHPGMLDNMVAGGQPHGISLRDNVIKECGEEAGIARPVAATAVPVGVVSYTYEDRTGLKPDTMFCFDLELTEDFVPRGVDGEVEAFTRMPIAQVASIVSDSNRFKFNCNLVVIDFLVRHGLLDIEHPDLPKIVAGLRRAHPPWLTTSARS